MSHLVFLLSNFYKKEKKRVQSCLTKTQAVAHFGDIIAVLTIHLIQVFEPDTVFLLTYTDLPISEIASELHFSTVSYFVRSFRQCIGYTPLAYRKMEKP